jgi:hypothetical protein
MYYVNIGLMSATVNLVVRVLYELAAHLIMLWHGPGVSSEYVFAVLCVVIYKCDW